MCSYYYTCKYILYCTLTPCTFIHGCIEKLTVERLLDCTYWTKQRYLWNCWNKYPIRYGLRIIHLCKLQTNADYRTKHRFISFPPSAFGKFYNSDDFAGISLSYLCSAPFVYANLKGLVRQKSFLVRKTTIGSVFFCKINPLLQPEQSR